MYKQLHDIETFLNGADKVARIEVTAIHGSTPRDTGTWMLLSESRIFRTIGGGQLENLAIEKARELLKDENTTEMEMRVPLGPHIGQCCGGTVDLRISVLNELGIQSCSEQIKNELQSLPRVYVFGAGHVGIALCRALMLLPVCPILVDTRGEELAAAPEHLDTRLAAMPETEVRSAPDGSAFVILTHDHALDFLITREALARKDAAYVGLIGSKTKRATFRNWLRRENGSEAGMDDLICPIGNTFVDDKRPEIIAALAAAEIIQHLNAASTSNFETHRERNTAKLSGGN